MQAGAQSTALPVSDENAGATPSDLTLSAGFADWYGDFGAPTKTNIWSILFGARYRIGGLRLSASLPRMHIRTDGTFFAGLGGTPLFVAPNIRSVDRIRNGFGDLTVGASYLLPRSAGLGLDIDLSARAKIPTATKTSQLSTGKADYSIGVDVSKTIGRVTPTASATYRIFGDTGPWHFRNGFHLSAGATYALSPKTIVLGSYDYKQASNRFIRDSHEAILGVSTPLGNEKIRLTGYASKGFSKGAADVSGGISLAVAIR